MDQKAMQAALKTFRDAVSQEVGVDEMIIFGSYLEGTATEDSDIDVIVVSKDFETMDKDRQFSLRYESSDTIDPEIHPWPFTRAELEKASALTAWGYARDKGLRFA